MKTESFTLVLLGATGDLARIKIWPAIYRLYQNKLLPVKIRVIANGRTEHSDEDFRDYLYHVWQEKFSQKYNHDLAVEIASKVSYLAGDLTANEFYSDLKQLLNSSTSPKDCNNRIFHLAIMPSLYQQVVEKLGQSGLAQADCGWLRLLVEKPFGENLASAQELDKCLKKYFTEEEIYRIDHYLAKETVQNISAFRFANELFEPQLNKQYIDHIQISFLEEFGIKDRGKFYERVGAIRDVVQNHLLQLLAVVTMDDPRDDTNEAYRDSRNRLLESIRCCDPQQVSQRVIVGQYASYLKEKNVAPDSRTETFMALKTFIDNERWRGVPVYVRAGKKLCRTVTDIMVVFRDNARQPSSNVLNFRIAPDESIILRFYVKKPGPTNQLEAANLQFHYKQLKADLMEAYERIVLDAYTGNQLLFTTAKEVEAEWRFVDPIIDYLKAKKINPEIYPDNTWGPKAADKLIQADGREWLVPSVDLIES